MRRIDYDTEQWRVASFGTVTELSGGTRGEVLSRLRLRTMSIFAYFSPEEPAAGSRQLERALAADPDARASEHPATLLTLESR